MRKIVAANWKMHHGPDVARTFARGLSAPPDAVHLILFPPAVSLTSARDALGHESPIALGVQNVHEAHSGAYTGETSAGMAREAGARYALVGHSERRSLFGETPETTGRKLRTILDAGLIPMLCVGETLEERRAGRLVDVLENQLTEGLRAPEVREALGAGRELLIAYEPVWAIGTGETATPGDASHAHSFLLQALRELLGGEQAPTVPILYGGSVTPDSAAELLGAPGVDGVLVGGASLVPQSLDQIVSAAAASS